MTEAIATENAKKKSIESFHKAHDEATRVRKAIEQEITTLPSNAPAEHLQAHADAVAAHKVLQDAIQQQASRAQRLHSLRTALLQEQARMNAAHQELRGRYPGLLDEATWERLRAEVDPAALTHLETLRNSALERERQLRDCRSF
jgi:uncharacterized membrane protein YgaE (UPF0421/DUF939 family)